MNRTYRWGILGPGRIAQKFARDMAVLPQAKLHAVASRSLDRAREFAAQYGATHAFGSYEELFQCPDLDVIYIATPHQGHFPWTMRALEHGIPVLVEKPFAINSRQARVMAEAAQNKGVFLMEALWTRFLPTMERLQAILREGSLGEILGVKADFGFQPPFDPQSRIFNPNLGGGALLDIGIYPVFLALFLLGPPSEITAAGCLGATGVDEELGILMKFPSGQMAHLHTTIRVQTKTEAFVYFERGTINLHSRWFEPTTLSVLRPSERPEILTFDYPCEGFSFQIAEVMRCLDAGLRESPLMPLDFSIGLMETLDAIRHQIGLQYPEAIEAAE
ncbi:MAG: scyllo-inositol 2-dehydrogenase (NADP(+)) IolU [Haliscomenobacter sp.]|jgi:predicted dehydrogenase|nr:scyllo-inositol 2-dehydrogenase (NADP(+)) IolU [Haliscomenobacter sp.]